MTNKRENFIFKTMKNKMNHENITFLILKIKISIFYFHNKI